MIFYAIFCYHCNHSWISKKKKDKCRVCGLSCKFKERKEYEVHNSLTKITQGSCST